MHPAAKGALTWGIALIAIGVLWNAYFHQRALDWLMANVTDRLTFELAGWIAIIMGGVVLPLGAALIAGAVVIHAVVRAIPGTAVADADEEPDAPVARADNGPDAAAG